MDSTQFKELLEQAIEDTQADVRGNLDDVALYAAQRTAHLQTIIGQPGYNEALKAERDAVLLRMGINAVDAADAADQRLVGIIQGVFMFAARIPPA